MTRYAYIFLDESGIFDFGNCGTCYLVLTSVGISRPSPMWDRLDDYKYHCIEFGTDIEYFGACIQECRVRLLSDRGFCILFVSIWRT